MGETYLNGTLSPGGPLIARSEAARRPDPSPQQKAGEKCGLEYILTLALVTGCSVKGREVGGNTNPLTSSQAMVAGVLTGEKKKILVKPSRTTLNTNEDNVVSFQIVDENLLAVSTPGSVVSTKHSMPKCEGMKEPKEIALRQTAPGTFELVHETSMSDEWLFEITVVKDGARFDTAHVILTAKEP